MTATLPVAVDTATRLLSPDPARSSVTVCVRPGDTIAIAESSDVLPMGMTTMAAVVIGPNVITITGHKGALWAQAINNPAVASVWSVTR